MITPPSTLHRFERAGAGATLVTPTPVRAVNPDAQIPEEESRCPGAPDGVPKCFGISALAWGTRVGTPADSDPRFLRISALSGERERTGCFRTRDSREFGV